VFVSDVAVFVLKRDVKLQPTNKPTLFVYCKDYFYLGLFAACCVAQKIFVIFTFSEHHVEEVVKLIRFVTMNV